MTEKCDLNRCESPAVSSIEDDEGPFSFCAAHFDKVCHAALHEKLSLADAVDAVTLAETIEDEAHESIRCPQCRDDETEFKFDPRTGDYQTSCRRCGYRDWHRVSKGFGVLWFKYSDEPTIFCHYLHTARESFAAERWLRRQLRTGVVFDLVERRGAGVEVVLGILYDWLAGKIVSVSGLPGEMGPDNRGNGSSNVLADQGVGDGAGSATRAPGYCPM